MRIQIIKNRYRLPFKVSKPIFPLYDDPTIRGEIITVYALISNLSVKDARGCIEYYVIIKLIEIRDNIKEYYVLKYRRRKAYSTDNKFRIIGSFESYDEAKVYIEDYLHKQTSNACIDIIPIRQKE